MAKAEEKGVEICNRLYSRLCLKIREEKAKEEAKKKKAKEAKEEGKEEEEREEKKVKIETFHLCNEIGRLQGRRE